MRAFFSYAGLNSRFYSRPKIKEIVMLRTYAPLVLAGLLFIACGGEPVGSDLPAPIVIPNFSEKNHEGQGDDGETGQLTQGLNYGVSSYVSGSGVLFQPWGLGIQPYFATLTPQSGNPDLYRYTWSGLSRLYRASSSNGDMLVDRLQGSGLTSNDYFYVMSGAPSGFTFSVSWEVNGRLELDVPYLNQNTIPTIGPSACASASTAMVFAYHAKLRVDKMVSLAQECFSTTSGPDGVYREKLPPFFKGKGFSYAALDPSGQASMFATILSEIRAGRPLLLGTKSTTAPGHWLVITGFNGTDYRTAKLILNDPNGQWNGAFNGYPKSVILLSGKGVEYSFAAVVKQSSDTILIVRP